MIGVAATELTLLAALTLYLVAFYRAKSTSLAVTGLIFCCWYLAFSGTLLLPIDLACSAPADGAGEGDARANERCVAILKSVWDYVYWITFALAWLVLPVALEVMRSGDFSFAGRVKHALRRNLISYAIGVVLGLCVLIYLAANSDAEDVVGYMMAFGNTYGLVLIVLLLGHGLVDVPRSMWDASDPESYLKKLRLKATCVDNEVYDASVELDGLVSDARAAARAVERLYQESPSSARQLKDYMRCVIATIQSAGAASASDASVARGGANNVGQSVSMDAEAGGSAGATDLLRFAEEPSQRQLWRSSQEARSASQSHTRRSLADLHGSILEAQTKVFVTRARWEALVREAVSVEHMVNSRNDRPGAPGGGAPLAARVRHLRHLLWYYWCAGARRAVYRALAVVAASISALLVWSEALIPSPTPLSPFGAVLSACADRPSVAQGLALLPLTYMSLATYRSLFKFKLVSLFHLQGPSASPAAALVFNAAYLVRLQFPLCYNFTQLLRIPRTSKSAFEETLMANMKTVPIMGTEFNIYGGVILCVIAAFTFFRGYARMLEAIGVEHEEVAVLEDGVEDDRVEEGRALLRRAVRQSLRARDGKEGAPSRPLRRSSTEGEQATASLLS